MPTYNALGVTATLSVVPLESTLSETLNLRMGRLQRQEDLRISNAFDSGRRLLERPLRRDDSGRCGLQFVGQNEDMALFVAEVGNSLARPNDNSSYGYPDSSLLDGCVDGAGAMLGAARSVETEQGDESLIGSRESLRHDSGFPEGDQVDQKSNSTTLPRPYYCQPSTLSEGHLTPPLHFSDPHALSLTVDYCSKTFLRQHGMKTQTSKDLKIEVFLNGQLVEVAYESSRNSAKYRSQRFSGTRIHRQSEKPWVYKPNGPLQDTEAARREADRLYNSIKLSLLEEVSLRGTDWNNEPPISAKFLAALADQELPEQIKTQGASIGTIDVIIVAGTGHKHGPETSYCTGPTRMEDAAYSGFTALALSDPYQESLSPGQYPTTPSKPLAYPDMDHPSKLTPQASNANSVPAAQTPSTHHPNDPSRFKIMLSNYENAKGQLKSSRSLRQRVGDMTKMSPTKRVATLQELSKELDLDTISAIKQALNTEADAATSPTLRKSVSFQTGPAFKMEDSGFSPYADENAIDPSTLTVNPSALFLVPELPGPTAQLPSRRSRASLASSSTSPSARTKPLIKRKAAISPSPLKERLGAKRTASRWDPSEMTITEALEGFGVPESCIGSSVGYPRGLEQRQIAKARGGEFREEAFVVGMRFVVL